jgi:ABC-type molybdate transport system substrate-binding protein
MRVSANRGVFVRAVCVLCIALVCVMGTIQAVHTHSENSTTSHHTCSVCATAHAGVNAQTVVSAPVLAAAALATPVAEVSAIFRPATSQFIRPPPVSAL